MSNVDTAQPVTISGERVYAAVSSACQDMDRVRRYRDAARKEYDRADDIQFPDYRECPTGTAGCSGGAGCPDDMTDEHREETAEAIRAGAAELQRNADEDYSAACAKFGLIRALFGQGYVDSLITEFYSRRGSL